MQADRQAAYKTNIIIAQQVNYTQTSFTKQYIVMEHENNLNIFVNESNFLFFLLRFTFIDFKINEKKIIR